jgi:hypothetical protein
MPSGCQQERQKTMTNAYTTQEFHKWNSEFCSCGQDTFVCQGCGQIKCGSLMFKRVEGRNFCVQFYCPDAAEIRERVTA